MTSRHNCFAILVLLVWIRELVLAIADFLGLSILPFPRFEGASREAFANALILNGGLELSALYFNAKLSWAAFRRFVLLEGATCPLAITRSELIRAHFLIPLNRLARVSSFAWQEANIRVAVSLFFERRTRLTVTFLLLGDRPCSYLFASSALLVASGPFTKSRHNAILVQAAISFAATAAVVISVSIRVPALGFAASV